MVCNLLHCSRESKKVLGIAAGLDRLAASDHPPYRSSKENKRLWQQLLEHLAGVRNYVTVPGMELVPGVDE